MGRNLAIHLHYYGLNSLNSSIVTSSAITSDIAHHRMPSVTWSCGAPLIEYYQGGENGLAVLEPQIKAAAYALKALNVPVFFRLFFEFNDCLSAASCANGYAPNCFPQGTGIGNTQKSAEFKLAWNYIYTRFQYYGATNVAFVWDPSGPPGDVTANNLQYYVPDPAYVDWVGFDCYDKQQIGFVNVIQPFYSWFTSTYPSYGKPMILEETGEENNDTTPTCDSPASPLLACSQTQYFSDIGANIATDYPLIKAVVYFDASTAYNWLFDGTEPIGATPATGGYAAWNTLAGSSYFSPMGY